MKEYVGILLDHDYGTDHDYFKQNVQGFMKFFTSYEHLLMQCDSDCSYLLIPLTYTKCPQAIHLAASLNIPIYEYYFIGSHCRIFKLEKTDFTNLFQKSTIGILYLRQNAKKLRVPKCDILYIESNRNCIYICTKQEKLKIRMRISEVQAQLEASVFIRCHQSFILNMNQIYSLKRYEAIMINNDLVPISKAHSKEVRVFYEQLYSHG